MINELYQPNSVRKNAPKDCDITWLWTRCHVNSWHHRVTRHQKAAWRGVPPLDTSVRDVTRSRDVIMVCDVTSLWRYGVTWPSSVTSWCHVHYDTWRHDPTWHQGDTLLHTHVKCKIITSRDVWGPVTSYTHTHTHSMCPVRSQYTLCSPLFVSMFKLLQFCLFVFRQRMSKRGKGETEHKEKMFLVKR